MDKIRAQFCACFLQDFNQRPPRSGKNAVGNYYFTDTTKCRGRDLKKDMKNVTMKNESAKRKGEKCSNFIAVWRLSS
jgi:hypothetical protein